MAESKVKVVNNSIAGGLWLGGWLFTIGFLKLTFFKGLIAIFLWPYYLGVYFSIPSEALLK